MPYRLSETTKPADMLSPPPFGPGFTPEQVQRAQRMEVWGSRFDDPGPDYVDFMLLDAQGTVIARRRIDGY